MSTLDLGVIGNCSVAALVDPWARIVWCCLPRFDGDPVFHALIDGEAEWSGRQGYWAIELMGQSCQTQRYIDNTAVLQTVLEDGAGNSVEVVDFAPRFITRGRSFRPQTLVRRVRVLSGRPRIRIRLRPAFDYGAVAPVRTSASNHIRYIGPQQTIRLSTDAPISYVLDETPFLLEAPLSFILGPDETLQDNISTISRSFMEETQSHWQHWVRRLALPLEWQSAVIRSAITLKLCTFEETGAIIAAMTTSIPEAPGTQRNWDYRYCWLRDAFFVVRALNSLSEVETMENYLRYLANIVTQSVDGTLQPVYGIGLEACLSEREVTSLHGYRGMGPVRAGNQAHEHSQHDVYGNVILAAAQAFWDERLLHRASMDDYERLKKVAEQAYRLHRVPDAGMWELRTRASVHTSSTLMCWAACDRMAKIAAHLGLTVDSQVWAAHAAEVRDAIETDAWNPTLGSYTDSFGGRDVEAGLLLMGEVGYADGSSSRYRETVATIERRLRRGGHLFRYASADDFGLPETAFNVCTFWYIDALSRIGRIEEARELFEQVLQGRNAVGLLSEDTHPVTGEHWGNYPQTYSLVGIINAATRLSKPWTSQV